MEQRLKEIEGLFLTKHRIFLHLSIKGEPSFD